jgi:hypothetical protein
MVAGGRWGIGDCFAGLRRGRAEQGGQSRCDHDELAKNGRGASRIPHAKQAQQSYASASASMLRPPRPTRTTYKTGGQPIIFINLYDEYSESLDTDITQAQHHRNEHV